MRMNAGVRWAAICVLVLIGLTGCKKPVQPNEQPVSFWANPNNGLDEDPCTHATAQAIVKSGLPYPNFTYEEVAMPGGTTEKRIKTVDVWVGPTRFVLPGKLVKHNGMYADNHPMRFWGLGGSLPNFYPIGQPGPVIDGMGSMVDIKVVCSMEPAYLSTWAQGYRSNQEGIEKVRAQYESRLKDDPRFPGTVTVSIRNDLQMTEVLMDRYTEANGQRSWEASYWPFKEELQGPSGNVSGISCKTRHDVEKRYGKVGWRCSSSISIVPHATATIDIYVSQIQHMPAIYEQVTQLFLSAKQN